MQRSLKIVFVPVLLGILLLAISCNFGTSFPELLDTGGIPADAVYDGEVAAITPVFPADGSASGDLTPLFRWSENSAATDYEVKILATDGTTAAEVTDITGTSYQLSSSSLQLGANYTWQVRIAHADGHYGAWQGPWTFSADRLRENLEEHGMENYIGEGTPPVVYSDADGGFYHVIPEYQASLQNYRFGSRDAGGAWNAEVKLNADEVELFSSYIMTGDKAGNLYLVGWDNAFLDDSGHPTALQAKKYSAGSWTDLDDIDTEVVKFRPIAVGDELWVVYITRSGADTPYTYHLMFSYYDGSSWSAPDEIQQEADGISYYIIGLGKNDAGNPVVLLEYPELETYTLHEQTGVGTWSTTPGLTVDETSLPADTEFNHDDAYLLVPSADGLHFITATPSVSNIEDIYGITIDNTTLSGTLLVEGNRSSGDDKYEIGLYDWDIDSSGVFHLVYTVEESPPAYFTDTDFRTEVTRSYYTNWDPSSGDISEPDGLGDDTVLEETDTFITKTACTVGSDDTLHILYNFWPPTDTDPDARYWTYERMGK